MINLFRKKNYTYPVNQPGNGGWFSMFVNEPFTGAWQNNVKWKRKDVISHFAIFSCISLIASDISKLWIDLVAEDSKGIWNKIPLKNFEVIRKPNHYQNRIQFFESWLISKLSRGNTYVLKGKNSNGKVDRLYVLSPDCVQVLVSDDGEIFYQLSQDNLTGIEAVNVTVPASEIIHDRFNCLFHPLIGLSPIFASGLSAYGGLKIMKNSINHFTNMSTPGGIVTAPGAISPENARDIKENWERNYGGVNSGKTAVLGDDLKYTPINPVSAIDSQLVEQLKLSADIVCATFHVPPYKVIGNAPAYNNIEALESTYYSQCLQVLIEAIELCLAEGLSTPEGTELRFDLDGLLRMDSKTQIETLTMAVKGGVMPPNVAMKRINLPPLAGGDTVYMQEQNYSLEALSKRDAREDPFEKSENYKPDVSNNTLDDQDEEKMNMIALQKSLERDLNL